MLCSLKLFVYIEVLQLLMGGPDIPFGEGTSNKAAGESSSAKRPRGRPVKVVHFHDDLGPTHFAKMVLSSRLEMLPIPIGFHPYLGTVSRTIILKTNTGCSRMIKIGYFLAFKVMRGDIFKVTIFNYIMTEVVQSESFIETACQHLLLVGFDTLSYRRYYDTPPILVGHQDYFLAPLPGSEALLCAGIAMDEVRKKLFSISLSGKAAHWYKLLDNGDSLEWNDIVPRFYSKFYPPSEIHKDRNRIYNFWPHDGESIAQAWGRLKSLMLKCPIHELPGNVIIDNFYARLSFEDKTLLDTSCSGSFTRNKEEFKRDLLNRIQENTEGWEIDKDRESGINYDYKCIEAFMDTDKFRNMSATYGLDSQVAANLYKAFASHYELPKKNFDKYHEPYKDKIDSSINKCVVVETVDHVIPEAYIEKTPFPAKMKEYSVINSAVHKSEKKPIEPEEQIKVEPAIVKDLVTENVEDGHIIFCEDASNIIMHEIGSCELEDIDVVIQLANRETISPIGIVRDVEVLCDCKKEKILTKFAGESYEFNFSKFTKTPYKADLPNNDFKMEQCASIVLVPNNPLQQHLENSESEVFRKERDELEEIFLRQPILKHDLPVEDLGTTPPPKEDPVFDLKPLPDNLKYAHIDDKKIYPVIISSKLTEFEEERLLEILKKHRGAIGYTLDDLKGISPSICQHAINMEDDAKPVVEPQRRLIPKMKDVVRNEVLRLLEAGIIYPIADSRWVSPVHCVPKKGGMTVVPNDNDELIPQRVVVGYRMCIDYRKVNKVFMDDFSVYGNSFDNCLRNLDKVLQRCEETNLVLNWEKCHFMVNEGIVLGHKISERGIEVDRAKVEAIEKMPYPRDVKGIRSVLGHAGFYRRFIKDFSKISKPLTNLLQKDRSPFECLFGKSATTAKVVDEAPGKEEIPYKIPMKIIERVVGNRYTGDGTVHPGDHLLFLHELCGLFKCAGIAMDEVRKKLFSISLSDKTLLDTSCSGSFTRNKEEFKRDLLNRIQENTEGWEIDKDRESGINYDYKCIEAFMDTDKFRNMSATYGLDSQVAANLYKAFASHYELPKKNFDKYHEPYKDKIDSSINKCVVVETVDHVIPEAYIEKTPFPAKMKEYSVINSAVHKSEKKPIEPEEQIKVEPAVAIVKDLVTENVEDGHIIFCEDASNIVSHPNKPKQASVPMLSVRIGDHCYYGLCDIGASISAIPYELYTEIMHEIGSCELEDIDVVIQLANRETISPIGIVRDVEVLCGKIKYPADFLVLGSAANCKKEKILTKFAGESYEFNFSKFTKTPYKADLPNNDFKMEQCASIVLVPNNPLQQHLENSESEVFRKERDELEEIFLRQPILKHDLPVEDLGTTPPPKEDPVFDLKPLPDNLKYAHIDDKKIYPVIISSKLTEFEEERLLEILKKHRGAIGYTLDDLKGISPLFANTPLIWKMMRSLLLNLSVV
ncbi:hypothetical protein QYE76_024436 [Lolium multiflorum]|uniref:Retrotransposon gag domain-containing protein n=1 Tax=Lolium multiflorum TaxID=4521 RepID=A0AAD8VTM7_LOLMU|nr:hypothetical protein QYE76_024436 [Lolium multiflorum]